MTDNRTFNLVSYAVAAAAFLVCAGIAIYHEVNPDFSMGWVPRIIETLLIPTSLLLILLALIIDNDRMRQLAGSVAVISALFSIGFMWTIAVGARITTYSDSHWTEPLALVVQVGYVIIWLLYAKRKEEASGEEAGG